MPTIKEISDFSETVEILSTQKQITILESIQMFCQMNDIDLDTAGKLISKSLKRKIKVEAENLNLLKAKKKSKKLPL